MSNPRDEVHAVEARLGIHDKDEQDADIHIMMRLYPGSTRLKIFSCVHRFARNIAGNLFSEDATYEFAHWKVFIGMMYWLKTMAHDQREQYCQYFLQCYEHLKHQIQEQNKTCNEKRSSS